MNLQQMYDILLKNNLSASQNMFTLYISWRQSNELTANVWYTFKEQPFSFSKTCLLYIFRGGRVMNLQQMYDILLKNNLSASQNMFTLYISWRQSNELTANVWYTFKEQPFSFSKTCLLYIFRGGRVMNLQQMYDILLKNNLSASQKHVYFIYFVEAE